MRRASSAYRSIAERRRQLGVSARTHCDIVVKVEPYRRRILAVGGNVRGTASLKLLPAADDPDGGLRPLPTGRRIFAHFKLRAPSIAPDALDQPPTMPAVRGGLRRLRTCARQSARSSPRTLLRGPDPELRLS